MIPSKTFFRNLSMIDFSRHSQRLNERSDTMTQAEIMRVDMALESVGGNRAQAAAILDMPKKKLSDAVRNNEYLRGKWMITEAEGPHMNNVKVPTEAPTFLQTFDPPAPCVPPVTPSEQEAVIIYERENEALKKGFADLGLTEEQTKEAIYCTRFYAQHTGPLCDLFGGTLTKHGLRLGMLLTEIENEIKDKNFRDIYSPDGTLLVRSGEESKFDLLYRGFDQLRKLYELLNTARMNSAKIKMWEQHKKNGANGKTRKPGFTPLERQTNILAQPGSTVNLNGQQPPPTPPSEPQS